ncbi:MAG TPA: hypothetical protein VHZ95_15915, partial [Polyangiales bacterium]|nr:hypothetical protein [Polyangiales bacterium]
LAVERELQDAREKGTDLQREFEKKNEVVAALTADKDSVRKRLDDAKARAERAEAKVKELDVELDGLKTRHQSELESLRNEHSQAHARAQEEHTSEIERLKQNAAGELEALQKEHAAARTASQRAHADELSELREEHAVHGKAASERAEQEKRGALDALRHELTTLQQERAIEAENTHRSELAAQRAEAENRHTSELAGVNEKHRQEVARLGKLLSEAESRHALLEERHEETESARANTESQLRAMTDERDQQIERNRELSGSLERVRAKSAHDEEILDRVRKALAIGLGLLEEQKQGSNG